MTTPTDEHLDILAGLLTERLNAIANIETPPTPPAPRRKPEGPACNVCSEPGRHYTVIVSTGTGKAAITRVPLCPRHGGHFTDKLDGGFHLTIGGRAVIAFDPTVTPLDELLA